MSRGVQERTTVSTLLGAVVVDGNGTPFGRVREFAVSPLENASRVAALVVRRTGEGRREPMTLVTVEDLERREDGALRLSKAEGLPRLERPDDYLLLERDLLDQQIIDVHGHKVVRVNDVDLVWEGLEGSPCSLRVAEVEVGARGAVRRMLKGFPAGLVDTLACKVPGTVIPWEFVDLIDRDPARRVKLKIEQDRLAKMHPSDLAAILEELSPPDRKALFTSLDEEVAAEALEEVELKTQKELIETMDSEQVAGIIEEMDPSAAADLLSELPEERSDAILEELDEEERHDLEELLEASPHSAAGMMTTEYVSVPEDATVRQAIEALGQFEGDPETVTDVLLVNAEDRLTGIVPLSRLLLAAGDTLLGSLHEGHMVCSGEEANGRKVAELFDKYNLRCLPVVDAEKRLAGVIHAEHVIAWLRTGQ